MRLAGAGLLAVIIMATGCSDDGGGAKTAASTTTFHLGFLSASSSPAFIDALKAGLEELGYVEGENIRLDLRTTEDEAELPAIAQEFVAADVDVIIAGGTKAVQAAKDATTSIPIVMTNSGDPVGTGLVESLARPGGNVTGLTQISSQLAPKRLELVKEAFPGTTKVAMLLNPDHPATKLSVEQLRAAGPGLGMELVTLEVKDATTIPGALAATKSQGTGALIVLRDPFTVNAAEAIASAATDAGLPAMYETTNFLEAGGLMLFGPDFADLYLRSANYVDKILEGADPATLPIEQPTEFELVINFKAVALLGVDIPEQVRLRAEEFTE